MQSYRLYDENNAPQEAQQTLLKAKRKYGFIPNLMATMAGSPALVKGYLTLTQVFEETSFSDVEKQLILLAVSYENICHYCMAAHSTVAQKLNVPDKIIEALRNGSLLPDQRLESLRQFVLQVVKNRGHVAELEVEVFLDAGYTHTQVLEVIVGVGVKILANYTIHLVRHTPLDAAFQQQKWNLTQQED